MNTTSCFVLFGLLIIFTAFALANSYESNFATNTGLLKNVEQNRVLDAVKGRKTEGVSRFHKQHEVPLLERAKVLDLVAKEKTHTMNLQFYRSSSDNISSTVEKNGYYRESNYRVFGSKASITFIGQRHVFVDALLDVAEEIDLIPTIAEDDAIWIAISNDAELEYLIPEQTVIELLILPSCFSNERGYIPYEKYDGRGNLAYLVELSNNNVYFVDAHHGEVLFNFNNEQNAFASTYYNGNVTINTYETNSSLFWLEDLNRTSTAVNCNYVNCTNSTNNNNNYTKYSDDDNLWISTNDLIATQAQWSTGQVLDYFRIVQGRNGLDGVGGPATILSQDNVTRLLANKVHVGGDPNTASWTGTDFIYGDGDGVNYGPMVALDIVAHEMAHAIMEYEANLVYYGQSGALTESFGDITAAVVSYWTFGENNGTWLFGEDVYTPGVQGDAIRYLNNPHLAANRNFTADDDPDHTSQMYNGTLDNGGVHVNCGIPNKAFYLLAHGGNDSYGGVTMTGIGIDAAYALLYRAVTTYYTSTTQFADARLYMLYASEDLYGTPGHVFDQVETAWGLTGVGSIPTDQTNYIVNGGFEGSSSPWSIIGTGVTYTRFGAQKHSGGGYISLGVINSANGNCLQGPINIPPNSAQINLTYWIHIVTSESPNTVMRDRMWVDVRNNTNGAIINEVAAYSNLDASSGYIQYAISLQEYIGVSGLEIGFRVSNDANNPTTFYLDDVLLDMINY